MARHGVFGAIVAAGLVTATILVSRIVLGPTQVGAADAALDPAVTILATVVTFFAVATIAVSVSLTLLATAAAEKSESDLMSVLVDDRERDFLLLTIFVSFLVSLANLCLLAALWIQPVAALTLPAILAVVTLWLMVGYIIERVRLFDELGLAKFIARRTKSRLPSHSEVRADGSLLSPDLKVEIGRDLLRIVAVMRGLVNEQRLADARVAMELGLSDLEALMDLQVATGWPAPTGTDRPSRTPHEVEFDLFVYTSQRPTTGAGKQLTAGNSEDPWWAVEFAVMAAVKEQVAAGYSAGDSRLLARWLDWLASMLRRFGAQDQLCMELRAHVGSALLQTATLVSRLATEGRFPEASAALEMGTGHLTALIGWRTGAESAAGSMQQQVDVQGLDDPIGAELEVLTLETRNQVNQMEGHTAEASLWAIELASASAFGKAVKVGFAAGDGRLMDRWLVWLGEVWIQGLMPVLPRVQPGRMSFTETFYVFHVAFRFLRDAVAETMRLSTDVGNGWLTSDNRLRLGYLLGDLAAEAHVADRDLLSLRGIGDEVFEVLKAGTFGARYDIFRGWMVSSVGQQLKRYIDHFWKDDPHLPLFLIPDVLNRLGATGDSIWPDEFTARFSQSGSSDGTSWPGDPDHRGLQHPPLWVQDLRDQWAVFASKDFAKLPLKQRRRVRRRAGPSYRCLIAGLRTRRWERDMSSDGPEAPAWVDLVFVRELIARVNGPPPWRSTASDDELRYIASQVLGRQSVPPASEHEPPGGR